MGESGEFPSAKSTTALTHNPRAGLGAESKVSLSVAAPLTAAALGAVHREGEKSVCSHSARSTAARSGALKNDSFSIFPLSSTSEVS